MKTELQVEREFEGWREALPKPNVNEAVTPIELAVISGYTFVARSYAYDIRHLKEMMKQGIQHKGLAFIECL